MAVVVSSRRQDVLTYTVTARREDAAWQPRCCDVICLTELSAILSSVKLTHSGLRQSHPSLRPARPCLLSTAPPQCALESGVLQQVLQFSCPGSTSLRPSFHDG